MTDYLKELRDSARQVIAGTGTPAEEDKSWPLVVELGWLLASVPEEQDGLGLGLEGACTLHAELGRGLAGAPLLPATMALEALCHGAPADISAWLGRLTAGELATAPLVEPELGLEDAGTGLALTGLVPVVQSADRAGHVLVWTTDAECVALVSLEQAGVQVTARPTWDVTRRVFDLRLDNVALDRPLTLARGAAARALVARLQTLRDFSLAADSLGGAAALLELTVEHLQTRQQFGRPLALFQALKHRCADLKTQLAGAESLLLDSLARTGDAIGDPEAQSRGWKARYLACTVFSRVAEEALQLHGGIGMAAEHLCHFFLKRAMLNEHLGTREYGYERIIADSFLAQV
jgi:alkylation response protein AidB-like acyl-CoA dehydrogenase